MTDAQKKAMDELVRMTEEDGLYDRPDTFVDTRPECICTYVEVGRRLTQQVLSPLCMAHEPGAEELIEKDRDFL